MLQGQSLPSISCGMHATAPAPLSARVPCAAVLSPQDWDEERCGDDPLLTELVLELQDPTLSLTDGQLCTLRTLCSECAAAFEPRGESVLEREDSQPPARTLLREQSLSNGSREESLPLIPPIAGPDLKNPPGGVASRMWGYITNESAAAAGEGGKAR